MESHFLLCQSTIKRCLSPTRKGVADLVLNGKQEKPPGSLAALSLESINNDVEGNSTLSAPDVRAVARVHFDRIANVYKVRHLQRQTRIGFGFLQDSASRVPGDGHLCLGDFVTDCSRQHIIDDAIVANY